MNEQIDPFYKTYRGAFSSLLRWHEVDAFWALLREQAGAGWYVYTIGKNPPAKTASVEELCRFIEEIDARLRREHEEDYCGIIYVDSKTEPTYIKIYDPKNLGVVCGIGREPIPPGWIISKLAPRSIEELPPQGEQAQGLWQRWRRRLKL